MKLICTEPETNLIILSKLDLVISADYDLEYSSAAFNRLRISISALNGAILNVVDLKLAERSSVKPLVKLN